MKVLKINVENAGQSFELKFMPNANTPKDYAIKRTILIKDENVPFPRRFYHYFSYLLYENEIHILKYGEVIKKYLEACMSGFYGTKDGHLLFKIFPNDVEYKYYAKTNQDEYIYTETIEELMNFDHTINMIYDKDPFLGTEKIIHNIVKFPPFNPFDVQCIYHIAFDVNEKMGFMKIDNLHLSIKEPI